MFQSGASFSCFSKLFLVIDSFSLIFESGFVKDKSTSPRLLFSFTFGS